MGVGNRLRRDDGAGSWLIEKLGNIINAIVGDGDSAPENYLEKIVNSKPKTILIVDAIDFAGSPGDLRLIPGNAVALRSVSTHALSLRTLVEYLNARISAKIYIIGIQPNTAELGEVMCRCVQQSINWSRFCNCYYPNKLNHTKMIRHTHPS